MTKARLLIVIVLIFYTAVIFAPPLVYGYIYPNNGDDSGNHLNVFNDLASGYDYYGQYLLGKSLSWIADNTGWSINAIFLWLNFIVLWLIGIVNYGIAGSLFGWLIGLFAIPVVMFVSPSVLNLYDTGSIFDLVTVAIVVPLMVFGVRNVVQNKSRIAWAIITVTLFSLALVLHTSAVAILGVGHFAPDITVQRLTLPVFANTFLGFFMLALIFLLLLIYMIDHFQISSDLKIVFGGLLAIAVGLAVLAFSNLTSISLRFGIDLAILIGVIVALASVFVLRHMPPNLSRYAISILIIAFGVPTIWAYSHYNSAVKQVDKQAIAYVRELPGDYFSCSPEVAPWIYRQYVGKKYKDGALPYITRSKPMTSKTTPKTDAYWRLNEVELTAVYTDERQTFSSGNITIEVYR